MVALRFSPFHSKSGEGLGLTAEIDQHIAFGSEEKRNAFLEERQN
jgi:hypothetical protein